MAPVRVTTMSTRKTPTKAARATLRCTECGWTTAKWVGRCGECLAWGTVVAADEVPTRLTQPGPVTRPAESIVDVDAHHARAESTGVGEFDRVLGGGLVPGAVVLLAGEPGIGKSTLLLDVCGRVGRTGQRVLYLTGEESAAQIRLRAERIGAMADPLFLAAETDLAAALGHIEAVAPQLLVLDSVQTFASSEVSGAAGNVGQVREVAAAVINVAKSRNIPTILVGHVTKDGSIAGPRVLEHLVDVVVHFEGDRHTRLRLIRAVKNRYGPTDEVGCFDLSDTGILGLTDPSGLFLSPGTRRAPVAGTCVTVTLEGRRPLIAEVQSLVAPSAIPTPRRATSGLDQSRVAMLTAVLDRRAGINLRNNDVYVATVGGVRVTEPATDLAVALAIAGAAANRALAPQTVAFGEVGLAGELRPITGLSRRLAEAARLGFTRAIVPTDALATDSSGDKSHAELQVIDVPDLLAAVQTAILPSPG